MAILEKVNGMKKWSDGIYLLGQFNKLETGSWLLVHNQEGAILELPPYLKGEESPAKLALEESKKWGIKIKYLLCTHAHDDHITSKTVKEFLDCFPEALLYLQKGFRTNRNCNTELRNYLKEAFKKKKTKSPALLQCEKQVRYFEESESLNLGGEALHLIHAPKHSWTDTFVVFRGAVFSGDWELNTIRSVHDGKKISVSKPARLRAIDKMLHFENEYGYKIHKVFSVHANDRRDNVFFPSLMEDTKVNRKLW